MFSCSVRICPPSDPLSPCFRLLASWRLPSLSRPGLGGYVEGLGKDTSVDGGADRSREWLWGFSEDDEDAVDFGEKHEKSQRIG